MSRPVVYTLKVLTDPANRKELAAFQKTVESTYSKAATAATKAQKETAKGAKKQADAEEKEAKRAGATVERMIKQRSAAETRARKEEEREGKRVAAAKLRILKKQEQEEQKARRKAEQEEKRTADKLIREKTRIYEQTRTPAERYAATLRRLNTLVRDHGLDSQVAGRQAKAAYDKMRQEQENAGRSGSRLRQIIGQQTVALGGMAMGLLGVQQIVGTMKAAYAEWAAEIEKTGKAHQSLMQKMLGSMGEAGDLPVAPQIQAGLSRVGGATRAQKLEMYQGARDMMPLGSPGEILGLVEAAAPVAMLKGGEGMREFTSLAATLKKQAPGKSNQEVVALARAAQQQAGRFAGQLSSPAFLKAISTLGARGVPIENALGIVAAGTKQGLRPGTVATMLTKVAGAARPGESALATIQRHQRDKGLASATLGDEMAADFGLITEAGVNRETRGLVGSQAPGAIARERAAFVQAEGGAAAKRDWDLAVKVDTAKQVEEAHGRRMLREQQELEVALAGKGALERWGSKKALGIGQWAASTSIGRSLGLKGTDIGAGMGIASRWGTGMYGLTQSMRGEDGQLAMSSDWSARIKSGEDLLARSESAAAARSEAIDYSGGFGTGRKPLERTTASRSSTSLDDVIKQLREQQEAQQAGFDKVAAAVEGEGEKTRATSPMQNAVDRSGLDGGPPGRIGPSVVNLDLPQRQPGLGPLGRGT